MAIHSLLYRIVCDICGVKFGRRSDNRFRLENDAAKNGWWFRRRKDGGIARRGGKDYCSSCAAKAGFGGAQ